LIPHSLRLRLFLGAALWISLALLAAGASIAYLFTASVERTVRTDLSAGLARLVALIDPDAARSPALSQSRSDPRYDIPLSGIYWQVEDTDQKKVIRSRSLWDFVLDTGETKPGDGEQFTITKGPGEQSLSALSLSTRFSTTAGDRTYRIVVAQDRAILDESIRRFGKDLAISLVILGIALVAAAWLQVRLGLSPLRKLREDIEAIRHGARDTVARTYPSEVLPLVGEVNELLASQQKSMEFARARAADLAHGLKTPLSVLASVTQGLRDKGDTENADLVDGLASEMADRIDYQLPPVAAAATHAHACPQRAT
jgi:hypothetical protein